MKVKPKILIIACASIVTSLLFVLPWFNNHMSYENYHRSEEESYKKIYGTEMSALSDEKLAEASNANKQNLAIIICLNRYRKENHSFAPALTACKQELLYELTR